MSSVKIVLPYGSDNMEVSVPEKNLIGIYSPQDIASVPDVKQEIMRALRHPIGTPSLAELVHGKEKIVILADDNTRLTPTKQIIPLLLDEMNAAGVKDEQITIIIALGTHRFMTQEEIVEKFGKAVAERVTIKNHDFKNPNALIDLGKTANGTSVWVNREAYEADFKIGIGSIVPHHIPGFSGGAKIVQPGISGENTTAETHLLSVRSPRSCLGMEDSPVRRELNLMAEKIGMNTILNTILNRHGEVVGAFFGDMEAAFKEGVALSQKIYAVEIPEEADIVISGSHPCDIEFWQAHKTLYPSDLAVKAGGTIIIVTPCYEGVAVTHSEIVDITGYSSAELKKLVDNKKLPDEVAAALAIAWAQVKERETVYIVSQGIAPDDAKKLGFVPFSSVNEALQSAFAEQGAHAKVTVLTHAPDMLPIISSKSNINTTNASSGKRN
ncbi:nickel-dependent lactate racemase [Sporomusaceae bacterium BoRhaA]|uniref:nickel-dependent lactate racemase n=1 Tax=Pelorhabdus rhamnosifermentans TaxID=2772457 RepID=UPI001C0608AD|nr:nickel-dependent lactate racemase [Pelorhabdus rhamnosifermentans]MBU2702580.1 nickel-dependent lactate racemase [Pelorhabdus rhamnosifermentans]